MLESIATSLAVKFLLWKPVLYTIASVWGATVTFFLLFLVFACYRRAVKEGTVVPRLSKWMIGPALLGGAILDVIWNYTIGSLLFLQFPKPDGSFAGHTFTRRLQQLKGEFSWRGTQARFWATQLNWADPGHV